NFGFGCELKSGQNNTGSLFHALEHGRNIGFKFADRRHNQHSVMNRSTNPNSGFGPQTTCQTQHFCAVGLHMKVANRPWVRVRKHLEPPPKYRTLPSEKHRVIQGHITPSPKLAEHLMVQLQKVASNDWWLTDAYCQTFLADYILNPQHT